MEPDYIKLSNMTDTIISIWNDMFHENIPFEKINLILNALAGTGHQYLILTKRAERLYEFSRKYKICSQDNLWFGVSCENQKRADERISLLIDSRVSNRWVSLEPLLGEIILPYTNLLDWVVVGCETGSNRRPCKIEWIERIVFDQTGDCVKGKRPVFVKAIQGENGKVIKDINKFPESIRKREFPNISRISYGKK